MSISPKVMRSRRGESLWWGTGQTRSQLRFFWFSSQFVWFKLLTLGERMGKGCLIWAGMENQAVGPPDPSTLLAIQDGNNITTVDSPRNFQKNGYEWIVGLRFFTLLVILHLLNYFFLPMMFTLPRCLILYLIHVPCPKNFQVEVSWCLMYLQIIHL